MRYLNGRDLADLLALENALLACAAPGSGGALLLVPEAEAARVPSIQALARRLGCPVFGAIFPALIVDGQLSNDGLWVCPLPAGSRGMAVPLPADQTERAQVTALCSAVESLLAGPIEVPLRPNLFLIFDGLLPNIASLLEGMYAELGNRVDYFGVNAGSERFAPIPCLFDDQEFFMGGGLLLLLPGRWSSVLTHGFGVPEEALTATSCQGNRIARIDWAPAFEVYQRLIAERSGHQLDRENFYTHAVHFPLGLLRADGEVVVRIPVGVTAEGSLYCVGEVPEHAVLCLLHAPEADEGACIEHLAERLIHENGQLATEQLLGFYCAGRRMHLGTEGCLREWAALSSATQTRLLAGALTLGEIGSTRVGGYPMFHNACVLVIPWDRLGELATGDA